MTARPIIFDATSMGVVRGRWRVDNFATQGAHALTKALGYMGTKTGPLRPCLIWIDDKGLHLEEIPQPKGSDTPERKMEDDK